MSVRLDSVCQPIDVGAIVPAKRPSSVSLASSSTSTILASMSGVRSPSSDLTALAANMMMQTVEAGRAASEARMSADVATKDSLALALRKIEELTERLNKQDAEIVALKQNRAAETIAQTAIIEEVRKQVDELTGRIRKAEKSLELIKPLLRHVWIKRRKKCHIDRLGNLLDLHLQMVRPAGAPRKASELEELLDINVSRDELWRVGWTTVAKSRTRR